MALHPDNSSITESGARTDPAPVAGMESASAFSGGQPVTGRYR